MYVTKGMLVLKDFNMVEITHLLNGLMGFTTYNESVSVCSSHTM